MIGIVGLMLSGSSEWMKMGAFRPEREREGVSERCLRLSRTDRGQQSRGWGLR